MDYLSSKIRPAIKPLKLPPAELAALHLRYARRKTKPVLELLFRAHVPLAITLARRFSVHRNHVADVQMSAFRGLLEALKRYDPGAGKFATYAYWWVLKYVLKEREFDRDTVRLPLTLIRKHRKVRQLVQQNFSTKQVAHELKLSPAAVETLQSLYDRPHCVSLENEDAAGAKLVLDDSLAPHSDMLEALHRELDGMPAKWKTAAVLRFQTSTDRTFLAIGRKMKCSQTTASRYYHSAIRRLKTKLHQHG